MSRDEYAAFLAAGDPARGPILGEIDPDALGEGAYWTQDPAVLAYHFAQQPGSFAMVVPDANGNNYFVVYNPFPTDTMERGLYYINQPNFSWNDVRLPYRNAQGRLADALATAAVAGTAGAVGGAAAGSILPGPGTTLGAAIGAGIGAVGGFAWDWLIDEHGPAAQYEQNLQDALINGEYQFRTRPDPLPPQPEPPYDPMAATEGWANGHDYFMQAYGYAPPPAAMPGYFAPAGYSYNDVIGGPPGSYGPMADLRRHSQVDLRVAPAGNPFAAGLAAMPYADGLVATGPIPYGAAPMRIASAQDANAMFRTQLGAPGAAAAYVGMLAIEPVGVSPYDAPAAPSYFQRFGAGVLR